jgi:hypothetical protein
MGHSLIEGIVEEFATLFALKIHTCALPPSERPPLIPQKAK